VIPFVIFFNLAHLYQDERARLQEERDRYFAMYNEFRNRFASTVSARATVQSQLLQSEQERLAISQRLLETQIEVVAAREEAAANRCALDLRSLESDRELTSVLAQELQHHALEEHKQVTAQLHEAERQVDEMKARVSAATEEVQRVRASAAEQVRIAHSEVSALVERARAHAEKDSVLTERVAALEKELIGARTTAAEAVEQRLSAVTLCDEAQRKLHELEVDCAVLVATIEAAKTAAEDGEAQRHSLKQEKLDLREEANQTRQALASTEARLRLALDEVSSLSARLAIATDTISKLQDSQNENSQARVDSLAEIRALTKQLSAVEADKQHATVELQSIQAAYSKLQAQHAIATQKLGQFSAVLTATRTTAFDSWQAKRDTTSPLPVVHDEVCDLLDVSDLFTCFYHLR
jgi:chromosome segregation ATPase